MAQKRQPEEGKPRSDGNNSPDEKRRRFDLKSFLSPFLSRSLIYLLMMSSVVQEVVKMQSVQHLLEPVLEPLIRSVVCHLPVLLLQLPFNLNIRNPLPKLLNKFQLQMANIVYHLALVSFLDGINCRSFWNRMSVSNKLEFLASVSSWLGSAVNKKKKLRSNLEWTLWPLLMVKEEVELALRKHLANMKRNIGKEIGLLSECQYVPLDKLSETEKADAQNLVITAFEHWEQVISFDDETSLVGGSSQVSDVPYTSSSPRTENSCGSKILASQKIEGFDYAQPSASSPDIMSSIYTVGGGSGLDDYALQGIESMSLRYDQTLNFPSQVSNSLICDTDSLVHAFCDEEHLRFFDTDLQTQNLGLETQADLQSAVDSFLLARSTAVAVDKAQRRWAKIFSVLKWFSIRKLVATRKNGVRGIYRY
ncbi:hypothetical protein POTOM_042048 [Populus tomentosa]|uniref:Calmodulin binding protein C-terminal domain-containing protein n=1 Tax=Populus tomentosa TaxID=118781 RepID=A0A8X8CH13_POPTO|nr:hypothetical protein POTOM_042048 [Populus tomentosa]